MKHTTKIELANLKDLNLANAGVIKPKEVRRVTVEDALVDTGATRLSLPKSLIEQLGLTSRWNNTSEDSEQYCRPDYLFNGRIYGVGTKGDYKGNRLTREYACPCEAHDFGTP